MKKVNEKSNFKKIAQSLGIAIPASLLLTSNVNAKEMSDNKLLKDSENTIALKQNVNSNEVFKYIVNKTPSQNFIAHCNSHSDYDKHTNAHTDNDTRNYHTNSKGHVNSHVNKSDC